MHKSRSASWWTSPWVSIEVKARAGMLALIVMFLLIGFKMVQGLLRLLWPVG